MIRALAQQTRQHSSLYSGLVVNTDDIVRMGALSPAVFLRGYEEVLSVALQAVSIVDCCRRCSHH